MFPGIWRHGDWIEITERGTAIIYRQLGLDDQPRRHPDGDGEIYRAVLALDEIVDALVVDIPQEGEEAGMPLFVVLEDGAELDDDLVGEIRKRIREDCSPRHVPDEVIAIAAVPRTLSGKVARGAGQAHPHGHRAREGRQPGLAREPRGARLVRGVCKPLTSSAAGVRTLRDVMYIFGKECARARESVSADLDRELQELDRRRLQAHLRVCADCSEWAGRVRATTAQLRDAPFEPSPVAVFALPRRGRAAPRRPCRHSRACGRSRRKRGPLPRCSAPRAVRQPADDTHIDGRGLTVTSCTTARASTCTGFRRCTDAFRAV